MSVLFDSSDITACLTETYSSRGSQLISLFTANTFFSPDTFMHAFITLHGHTFLVCLFTLNVSKQLFAKEK